MTHKDLPLALSFGDVLLVPQHSKINSRSEVDLSTKISEKVTLKIPLISANVDSITGVEMAIAMGKLGGLGILPRFEAPEETAEKVKRIKEAGVLAAVSVGTKEDEIVRAELAVKAGADILNVDVAHGHMQKAIDTTKYLRKRFGDEITIIGGIVATGDAAEAHFKAGADCVGVGVGGGSICTTRIMTGSGVPTLASLMDIADVARKHGKTFVPLAGIETSGDCVKSLAAGASAIWGGYLFSGTDESPGELVEVDGQKFKRYNGSTSLREKVKQVGKYENGKSGTYITHVEGVESLVPYKGTVKEVVESLLAGIRSGYAYSGAINVEELWKKAQFIRVTAAGSRESGSHAVITSKE